MNVTETCQRCKLPIVGTRYSFQVDAFPPLAAVAPVEIHLCTACLESMQRWMERKRSSGAKSQVDGDREPSRELAVTRQGRSRSSRKKNRISRSRYADSLTSAERWIRLRTGMIIALVVTAFAVLFVLIGVEITRYKHGADARSEAPALGTSPLPPVDRVVP